MRRIDRINRRKARLAATLLAFGVGSVGVVMGSSAAWTDSTTNTGNSVSAGTLDLTNSKDAAAVFTAATNVKPSQGNNGTVTVTNNGNVTMKVNLTQDTFSNTFASNMLKLKVHDDTRDWCYYPNTGSGACGTWGDWDARAVLNSISIKATDGSDYWPVGQAHTFTVSWELDSTSTNADQGKAASFRLLWDATS